LWSLVRPVRYADRGARPDVIASQERVMRFDGTLDEIKIVFNGTASVVGLGGVGRLAGWGWGRGCGCGKSCVNCERGGLSGFKKEKNGLFDY